MKTIILSAAVAAITLAAPLQAAEGMGILLGGGGWHVPACKQGRVLREVRDVQTGKLVWRCVAAPQQTAQVVTGPRK